MRLEDWDGVDQSRAGQGGWRKEGKSVTRREQRLKRASGISCQGESGECRVPDAEQEERSSHWPAGSNREGQGERRQGEKEASSQK